MVKSELLKSKYTLWHVWYVYIRYTIMQFFAIKTLYFFHLYLFFIYKLFSYFIRVIYIIYIHIDIYAFIL